MTIQLSRRRLLLTTVAAAATAQFPVTAKAQAQTQAQAQAQAQIQAKIAPPAIVKAGLLIMSINPTVPPLMYVNERGELQGMRVELGDEIARRLGLVPDYVRIDGVTTMIPGLAAKRWDVLNSGIFWSAERAKVMYMVPYEGAAMSIVTARGNPLGITTPDGFAGRRISVELGSTQEARTRDLSAELVKKGLKPIEIRSFNNFSEAFQALRAGQVEGTTVHDAMAMFMQGRGDFTRAISGLFAQESCLAFGNRALAEAVAGVLNDMKADGFYAMLLDRYGVLKLDQGPFAIKGSGPA